MRRAALIWAGAAAIALLFGWAQLHYGCGYFARGGSVLILYAAVLGALTMRALLDYREELDAIQTEQIRIARLMYVEDHGEEASRTRAAEGVERLLKAIGLRLGRLREAAGRLQQLVSVEAPIVLVGTVIWGFGDLLLPNPACAGGLWS